MKTAKAVLVSRNIVVEIGIITFLVTTTLSAAEKRIIIPEEVWGNPRTSESILGVTNMKSLVLSLDEDGQSRVIIYHSANDESSLHAVELEAWLVALGVAASRIDLELNDQNQAGLKIETRH